MPISFENINDESWLKISGYDSMRPFFMSIVSDSNHWMFISSNGGLTAGRKNSKFALFPYYTDDKITELRHTTGSKSIFKIDINGSVKIWEPFSDRNADLYQTKRNIYKNRYGNKILFEEVNEDLGLTFRYEWNSSNMHGFVKTSTLINTGSNDLNIVLLDGIQNIMPHGVSPDLQTRASNLVDAYKRSELAKDTGLGIFALSAIIVDKAEPSEALKANVAWSFGLDNPKYLLSSKQLNSFRGNKSVEQEEDIKGEKGAYFVQSEITLSGASEKSWSIVANVNLDHAHVIRLNKSIKDDDLEKLINKDIEEGTQKLKKLVVSAEGFQSTNDDLKDTRHFSNVLFNIMRGGTFDYNYQIEKADFVNYLSNASKAVVENNPKFINDLDELFDKDKLTQQLHNCEDADLFRLGTEYLPLKFSRRHGDPSRPWNQFSINTHSEIDGSKILDYEGNWRDIFQNWEALVHSYPEFLEGMIFKFLNATTFDGYNPYRVTKDGFDWETIEPDDPWSYIGYWGDHQIIYLLKFLEFYENYDSEAFKELFKKESFVYANVPYRIKSFEDIAKNPKDTIEFDEESDVFIRKNVKEQGADGALLTNDQKEIHRVNFIEKILATVLAKVSNFIPEAGIWMNTQRPEWNDANNALVGNGVSMVTLYYLRRFLKFFEPVLNKAELSEISVSQEMADLFNEISNVLNENKLVLNGDVTDKVRKEITERLGKAGSSYRNQIYDNVFSGEKVGIKSSEISDFIRTTLTYLEHSIEANKREDDLYHAYNIMSMEKDGISVSYLDEMLEGQVAVLSSGYLNTEQELKVLDALRNSSLYREDQQSYILYPNKELPGFLEKNIISESSLKKSKLLRKMISDGNAEIVTKDIFGDVHFNGNFTNAGDVNEALNNLKSSEYQSLIEEEKNLVLHIFEEVFNHKAFTGRSGTFFGYEGLGSIYWHMVSKLHLAVLEVCQKAIDSNIESDIFKQLSSHFDEIGSGIGVHKSPELYGAFPTDPYSHTPAYRGAQQPGMTGQVKEDILVRIGELGVRLDDGKLSFKPILLKKNEFTEVGKQLNLISVEQEEYQIELPINSLAFTCCQVPVVYQIADKEGVKIKFESGLSKKIEGTVLDKETTRQVFQRTGEIKKITVSLSEKNLR